MFRLSALCGLVLGSACAADELSLSETGQAATCSKYICGTNSPILGGLPFFELDQTGNAPAPDSGLRITKFESKGGVPLSVDVSGARLRGKKGNQLFEGQALVGSKLTIENDQGGSFQVTINSVAQEQKYWEAGNDGTALESYGMTYEQLPLGSSKPRNLCPVAASTSEPWATPLYHALIFQGDRYDASTGEVVATGNAAKPWFNVACAGDVLAKLLVTRHAEAAQDATHQTSAAQRTAEIRMFRADYCATGPNTALGVPLDWANVGKWNYLNVAPTLANVEAIWRDHGAVCVSNPRYLTAAELAALPCAPQACTQEQINSWWQYGDFITVNP